MVRFAVNCAAQISPEKAKPTFQPAVTSPGPAVHTPPDHTLTSNGSVSTLCYTMPVITKPTPFSTTNILMPSNGSTESSTTCYTMLGVDYAVHLRMGRIIFFFYFRQTWSHRRTKAVCQSRGRLLRYHSGVCQRFF